MILHDVTGRARADYHHFWVLERNGPDPGPLTENPPNGLISVRHEAVAIHTGVGSGNVGLRVRVHDSEPGDHDLSGWDAAVEASVHARSGELMVTSLFAHLEVEFPILCASGPGTYRLRVCAIGRDTAVDQSVHTPTENYLIEAWPAPLSPVMVVKMTDNYGKSLHAMG